MTCVLLSILEAPTQLKSVSPPILFRSCLLFSNFKLSLLVANSTTSFKLILSPAISRIRFNNVTTFLNPFVKLNNIALLI